MSLRIIGFPALMVEFSVMSCTHAQLIKGEVGKL